MLLELLSDVLSNKIKTECRLLKKQRTSHLVSGQTSQPDSQSVSVRHWASKSALQPALHSVCQPSSLSL